MCLCLLFRAARGECARVKTRAQPARVFVEPPFFLPPEMYKRKLEGKAYLSSPIKMGTVPAEEEEEGRSNFSHISIGDQGEERTGEYGMCPFLFLTNPFYYTLSTSIHT